MCCTPFVSRAFSSRDGMSKYFSSPERGKKYCSGNGIPVTLAILSGAGGPSRFMAGTLSRVSAVSTNVAKETFETVGARTEEGFRLYRTAVSPSSLVGSFIKTSDLSLKPEGSDWSGEDNLILPSSNKGFQEGGMGVQATGRNWRVEGPLEASTLSPPRAEDGGEGEAKVEGRGNEVAPN